MIYSRKSFYFCNHSLQTIVDLLEWWIYLARIHIMIRTAEFWSKAVHDASLLLTEIASRSRGRIYNSKRFVLINNKSLHCICLHSIDIYSVGLCSLGLHSIGLPSIVLYSLGLINISLHNTNVCNKECLKWWLYFYHTFRIHNNIP